MCHHLRRVIAVQLTTVFCVGILSCLCLLPAAAQQTESAADIVTEEAGTDESVESPDSKASRDESGIPAPAGIVYFVGSVERVIAGHAIADLGEVHLLRPRSVVAIFRSQHNHFTPIGTVPVLNTFPSYCQTDVPVGFIPEIGDLVVYIRTVGDLGTAEAIQNTYLTRQHVINANRNSDNTFRRSAASATLRRYFRMQPRWIEKRTGVTGLVTGESYAEGMNSRSRSLINQVNQFRMLQAEGVPVSIAAGPEWEAVMSILQGPPESSMPEGASARRSAAPKQESETSVNIADLPVADIQRLVVTRMFEHTREEQAIASALCLFLSQKNIRDEVNWIRRELGRSQFPPLGEDEQFQIDLANIMRILREPKS